MRRSSITIALLSSFSLVALACGDDQPAGGGGAGGGTGGAGGAGGAGDGVHIEGLSAPVRADYDDNGFLHLHCETDEDCFATLGYFHAANRFFFMDFVRNSVRGKLGALVKGGSVVLDQDFENRRFFSTKDGDPLETALYDNASPEVQGYLDAYTRGVNAWISDMRAGKSGATLTTEYDYELVVKDAIRDWEPEDSAAVGLYVLNDLSNNSAAELELATAMPAFDPLIAQDLFSVRPVFDAFTIQSAPVMGNHPAPMPIPDRLRAGRASFEDALAHSGRVGSGARGSHPEEIGSNNWVVGPDRTANGNALLANDPHLVLTNPSIWFPVEIDAKSDGGTGKYHIAGSTFPGLPSVMVGHNESIGWGVTTTYWDLADVYVEELSADGSAVIFNGEEVPIIEKELTFEDVESGMSVKEAARWVPHHGPIVSEDPDAGTAITIRWRGHDAGTDLDAFFAVAGAKDMAEAKKGIEFASSAAQNFVIIDTDGNFGWFPYSQVPSRPWASAALPPWMPLPGDGSAEWGDPVPIADLPQLSNPAAGFIATANQDMTGASADGDILNDGQAALQAWSKAEGTREQRIQDMLADGGSDHTPDSMHAIQGDTYSLYGSFITPIILEAASGATLTPEEQAVVDALTDWEYTCPTGLDGSDPAASGDVADPAIAKESIGCAAFHATLFSLAQETVGDEIAAAGVTLVEDRWDLHLVARALRDPSSIASGEAIWDDVSTAATVETRDDMILRALTDAATALSVSGDSNDWRWGRLHTLTLRSIYDSFHITQYNEGPYAAPGGLYTVNVANPSQRAIPGDGKAWNFQFAAGPSVRFVVEARPDGPVMTYELPGGADLHRESPFYNNLIENWLKNEPVEFPFGPDAVPNPFSEVQVSP